MICLGDCEYKSQFVYPEELCMRIPGDGSMFSMFRKDAAATQCPLKGPFMFSYAKGGTGRPCSYPKSYMDTCKDHNRLQLHYQACTDVQGSESTSEQLKCIANWNEGSKSYFVGELEHEHRRNEERRYRCFVYEQHGKAGNRTVRMAQSSSATCEGLWSPAEGYRVFDMERGKYITLNFVLVNFMSFMYARIATVTVTAITDQQGDVYRRFSILLLVEFCLFSSLSRMHK